MDLGTEAAGKWSAKVRNYLAYAAMRGIQPDNRVRLRFAVVTRSDARLAKLRSLTGELTTKGFRFTVLDTINRYGFWAPIWVGLGEDKKRSVI